MIDAVVKNAIEEALRFLRPGDDYQCVVNTHSIIVIALGSGGPGGRSVAGFLVACDTCRALVHANAPRGKAFLAIHAHTKTEEQPKELTDEANR